MNRVPGSQTQTWRSWLLDMIADSNERRRIADELGINPATLTRWAHNESHPRPQNLRQLLRVLPQHREVLLSLIQKEYPSFVVNDMQLRESEETRVDVIPGEFYSSTCIYRQGPMTRC